MFGMLVHDDQGQRPKFTVTGGNNSATAECTKQYYRKADLHLNCKSNCVNFCSTEMLPKWSV